MTDYVLWISGFLIVFIFAGVIWFNRKRMRAEVSRSRGGNPDFQVLAAELRRTNDILEKTLLNHEARLKNLEQKSAPSENRTPSRVSRSLN